MKWNPFKKKDDAAPEVPKEEIDKELAALPGADKMNMVQRFMARRILRMSPEERTKMMQKAMTPKNVQKHKKEILEQLDAMKKAGQMSDDQYRLARRKLGL